MKTTNRNRKIINHKKRKTNVLCSICVATYQRPQLLKNLLSSLRNQKLPKHVDIEVIIVDNDSVRSAQSVIHKFQNSHQFILKYFNQPEKNISLTRNMAVNKASGDYILFIDDDEVASPKWVHHLLETMHTYNADGVFGPVVPEFNPKTPLWMKRNDLFYSPVLGTGLKATHKWTSNCIVSAALLKKNKNPFDPSYGITGGEDTHLFDRLEHKGAHFVYCMEAWVSEFLPPNRTRISYIFLRSMRGGNTYTRRVIEFSGSRRIQVRIFMMGKSLTYGVTSLLLMIVFFIANVRRTKWLIKFASNIGSFLAAFGWHYQGYR